MKFPNETRFFYIVINYRRRHWKGIVVYNATKVKLHQRTVLKNKNVLLNIAEI